MSPDILLTPPLLARRLIAGFVIPWMLSLNTCNEIHITKDRVFRKSLPYLSVSLCSPLPKAFAPLAPPVIGHSSPFSSWSDLNSDFFSDPFDIWTGQIPLVCFGPRDCHYAIT